MAFKAQALPYVHNIVTRLFLMAQLTPYALVKNGEYSIVQRAELVSRENAKLYLLNINCILV